MEFFQSDIQLLPNSLDLCNYEFKLRVTTVPKLVWLRAFQKIYNPVLAIKVLSCLVERGFDASLVMVGPDLGDGSLEEVKQLIRQKGIEKRVEIPGQIPKSDVNKWLNKGDILLNTPFVDNTPVSVIEAMACGLCVVSTDVGGMPYLMDNDVDGLLVAPDQVEAMTNAVCRILLEPELSEKLSYNARTKIEKFNWSNILPIWEELLLRIITH